MVEDRRGYLYTGITTDVSRRVREHNTNKAKASKALWPHRPVGLVWKREMPSRSTATRLEARIKKLDRDRKYDLVYLDTVGWPRSTR